MPLVEVQLAVVPLVGACLAVQMPPLSCPLYRHHHHRRRCRHRSRLCWHKAPTFPEARDLPVVQALAV